MSDNNQNNNVWAIVVTVGVVVLACLAGASEGGWFDGDSSTTVPTLSTSDGSALAGKLAEAYDAQRICYGWRLRTNDGYRSTGGRGVVGSNFGDGRELDTTSPPEECDKAVVLVASVTYTSSSSESDDYASVWVQTHNVDLPSSMSSDFERFGVTSKTLVDDPVGAVARGTLALPLLVAEYGLAEPLPRPSASGSATAPPTSVGSDYLRDRGWLLITIVVLLAFTAFAVVFGIRSRRRAEEEAATAAAEAVRRATRAAEARRRRAEQNAATESPTT